MNSLVLILVEILVLQLFVCSFVYCNKTRTVVQEDNNEEKILSRRKRFLIFPEGSSLQLVFCCQTAAIIPIGDIFLFGNTAALSWNLPTDPKLFTMFSDYGNIKRMDTKTLIYTNEDGKIIASVPYRRNTIVNPAFAKRSIEDERLSFKEKLKIKIDRKKMHDRHFKTDYLKTQNLDKDSNHRSNRLELYEKLEALITALGRDGRQCVLYKLCEAAKLSREQGTFLQEFLRVVFTLPKGAAFQYDRHKEYDAAHTESDDCFTRYPGCVPDSTMQ